MVSTVVVTSLLRIFVGDHSVVIVWMQWQKEVLAKIPFPSYCLFVSHIHTYFPHHILVVCIITSFELPTLDSNWTSSYIETCSLEVGLDWL